MNHYRIDVGYVPLLDAAPLIIAREMEFAAEEGLELALDRALSWATLRDRLLLGQHQAAHMLAPLPLALSAGLTGPGVRVDAVMVLSVNGNTIGVRPDISAGSGLSGENFLDAGATGTALLEAAEGPLRFGTPFPFSMHSELLSYWLGALGAAQGAEFEILTIPPPYMAEAMQAGEIDAFCVGEPWGSVAVGRGVAELILPTAAIWQFAPEKVLAARHDWLEADPDRAGALMRAVWRAARWISQPGNSGTVAEILARPGYLDVAPDILERALQGRLVINGRGDEREVPRCIEFFAGAASFPWRSQALWIAGALARRTGCDPGALQQIARDCFRSDLYRRALGPAGADLPGASEKLEGALLHRTEAASTLGTLILGPDPFFDGRVFDPSGGS